jgi:hypothetical protein
VLWILEATTIATGFTNILFFVFKQCELCKCVVRVIRNIRSLIIICGYWYFATSKQTFPQNMECDGIERAAGIVLGSMGRMISHSLSLSLIK